MDTSEVKRKLKSKRNDRYDVEKVGAVEGPKRTSTSADFVKPWTSIPEDYTSDEDDPGEDSEGEIAVRSGRDVGSEEGIVT